MAFIFGIIVGACGMYFARDWVAKKLDDWLDR